MYYRISALKAPGVLATEVADDSLSKLEQTVDEECFLRDDDREAREMYLLSHHDRIDDN